MVCARARSLMLILLVSLVLLPILTSCGNQKMNLVYPDEQVDYAFIGTQTKALFLDTVRDLRPPEQRKGRGKFLDILYPSDKSWTVPIASTYKTALVQDIRQTQLVELVPLRGQADFTLSAEILSLTCRLKRTPMSFVWPAVAGMGIGMITGYDTSDRLKVGLVASAAAIMAIPMPTNHLAEAEVRLILRDRNQEIVWQRSCLGEVVDKVYTPATSDPDNEWLDKFLTKAIKRCNACLFGQLRQALIEN